MSKTLYGLFLEDINFAADGGLNANVVNNWTFDGAYMNRSGGHNHLTALAFKKGPRRLTDPLRHWRVAGGSLTSHRDQGPHATASFARLTITKRGVATVVNNGYPGPGPSMGARAGIPLSFSARLRADHFAGGLTISLVDGLERPADTAQVQISGEGWVEVSAKLTLGHTGLYALEIRADGVGHVDLDDISLVSQDHWGAGDDRWSQGKLRRDLVESLAALRPGFLRFPGGCIVEGVGDGNQYDWKETVGPVHLRTAKFNLWAESRRKGDYSQSNQIGFYEYFLLCEDLQMEPVPVVWAGLSCQFRSRECVRQGGPEFEQVVQDAVDLIDWAAGDPAESFWAALRAEAGHPEPFALNYLGIGNENHGAAYHSHFDAIKDAVAALRPGMRYILASGAFPKGKSFRASWAHAAGRPDVIVDEHSYAKPEWFIAQSTRYDSYPRNGTRVTVGEWAAHPAYSVGQIFGRKATNTWNSAMAEAAFLTGVERNADLVEMTCYAPLFALHNAKQWRHNLIEFTPLTCRTTVNYEVQKLFGEAVGTAAADVDVDGDEIFASATADADRLIIKIANTADARCVVTVTIPNCTYAHAVHLVADRRAHTTTTAAASSPSPVVRRETTLKVKDGRIELLLEGASLVRLIAHTSSSGPGRPGISTNLA